MSNILEKIKENLVELLSLDFWLEAVEEKETIFVLLLFPAGIFIIAYFELGSIVGGIIFTFAMVLILTTIGFFGLALAFTLIPVFEHFEDKRKINKPVRKTNPTRLNTSNRIIKIDDGGGKLKLKQHRLPSKSVDTNTVIIAGSAFSFLFGLGLIFFSFYLLLFDDYGSLEVHRKDYPRFALQCLDYDYSTAFLGAKFHSTATIKFIDNSGSSDYSFVEKLVEDRRIRLEYLSDTKGNLSVRNRDVDIALFKSDSDGMIVTLNFDEANPYWYLHGELNKDEPVLYVDNFPPVQLKQSNWAARSFPLLDGWAAPLLFLALGIFLFPVGGFLAILAFPTPKIKTPEEKPVIPKSVTIEPKPKKKIKIETPEEKRVKVIDKSIAKYLKEIERIKNDEVLSEESRQMQINILEEKIVNLQLERIELI